MNSAEPSTRNSIKCASATLYLAAGLAAAVLVIGTVIVAAPKPAQATPAFASQTGLSCGRCHTSPSGSALNSFGKAFQANGNKVPKRK